MISQFKSNLEECKIKGLVEGLVKAIINALEREDDDEINVNLELLLDMQTENVAAALALIELIEGDHFYVELNQQLLMELFEAHSDDIVIVCAIGNAIEAASDIDDLNRAPSEHPIFSAVIDALQLMLEIANSEDEPHLLDSLVTAARMMGRQYDELIKSSYARLLEIEPDNAAYHYGFGLFCKTRGLFAQGVEANQKAAGLVAKPVESYQWNLGICATGAKNAAVALDVWLGIGNKIKMGRFDLPDGGYPSAKVKLAEHPLAERTTDNDNPGDQETIWIERLSPCHGIIRSVLYYDLGVDYGDVILIDGAPITYHQYGDEQIPVFPHLGTLLHRHYAFYDFAAIQGSRGQVNALDESLDEDVVIYVHSENVQIICTTCFNDEHIDRSVHSDENMQVVKGRIAAPPSLSASELLALIDGLIVNSECELYAPALCEAAGEHARLVEHQQKFDMLDAKQPEHHH